MRLDVMITRERERESDERARADSASCVFETWNHTNMAGFGNISLPTVPCPYSVANLFLHERGIDMVALHLSCIRTIPDCTPSHDTTPHTTVTNFMSCSTR